MLHDVRYNPSENTCHNVGFDDSVDSKWFHTQMRLRLFSAKARLYLRVCNRGYELNRSSTGYNSHLQEF
jgi:hypothetical protein